MSNYFFLAHIYIYSLSQIAPSLFRFDKDAVKKILKFFVYFGNMPETVYVPYIAKNRVRHYIFGIEELFLMCLMYMCHPVRQLEVAIRFGRTVPEVSRGLTYFHGLLHPISQRFLQVLKAQEYHL